MFKSSVVCVCTISTSSEEHLFELVLPKPCNVGHIDVKFCFNSLCTASPNIQASSTTCYSLIIICTDHLILTKTFLLNFVFS